MDQFKDAAECTRGIEDYVACLVKDAKFNCYFSFPENLWKMTLDPVELKQIIEKLVQYSIKALPFGGTLEFDAENFHFNSNSPLPLKKRPYVKLSMTEYAEQGSKNDLSNVTASCLSEKICARELEFARIYDLMRKNEGYLEINSQMDLKTIFTLYIPTLQNKIHPKISKKVTCAKKRILVMEDDDMMRVTLREMLGRCNCESQITNGGSEAIKYYKEAKETGNPFQLAIIDLSVPGGMGGRETMKKLLEIDPDVKAIVSSGYRNYHFMSEYEKWGFIGALPKPYSITELRNLLQTS